MEKLKKLLLKVICYLKKPPASWGIDGGVNVMMESRRLVRQKREQRKQWESRYEEIVKKHKS